jgi:hypothetical protein
MHLDLSDEETVALTQGLHNIIESDRYPLSPRIRTLSAVLNKLRPEPVREPLQPQKVYESREQPRPESVGLAARTNEKFSGRAGYAGICAL